MLAERGLLRRTPRGYLWAGRDYPAGRLSLRSTSAGAVTVIQGTPGAMAPSEALASPIERLAELVEPAGMEFLRIGRPGRQPSSQ